MTLLERIKAAEQQCWCLTDTLNCPHTTGRESIPAEPIRLAKMPKWRERLTAKDTTDLVLGAWIGPKDRGAA